MLEREVEVIRSKVRERAKQAGQRAEPDSIGEALVVLLCVMLFGVGWAHLEIVRARTDARPPRRYAPESTPRADPIDPAAAAHALSRLPAAGAPR